MAVFACVCYIGESSIRTSHFMISSIVFLFPSGKRGRELGLVEGMRN